MFGSSSPVTTSNNLFGSTSANKTAAPIPTTTNLFGANTETPSTGFSFGEPSAKKKTPEPSAPSQSLFGSTTTTAPVATNLFGNSATETKASG